MDSGAREVTEPADVVDVDADGVPARAAADAVVEGLPFADQVDGVPAELVDAARRYNELFLGGEVVDAFELFTTGCQDFMDVSDLEVTRQSITNLLPAGFEIETVEVQLQMIPEGDNFTALSTIILGDEPLVQGGLQTWVMENDEWLRDCG